MKKFLIGLTLVAGVAFGANAQTVNLDQATAPAGGNVNLTAGSAASTTSDGGGVAITAGDGGATSGVGGNVSINAGNSPDADFGGDVSVVAGRGGTTSGRGGSIALSGGSSNDQSGGEVNLTAGDSNTNNGGGLFIFGGASSASGARSGMQIKGGTGVGYGGDFNAFAGNGGSSGGNGGGMELRSGDAASTSYDAGVLGLFGGAQTDAGGSGIGGDVNITSGSAAGSGRGGNVTFTTGTSGSGVAGRIVFNNLSTDATHTTRTVCQDTTTKALYFGSGAIGICLGTSSMRFKPYMADIDVGLKQVMALRPVRYKLDAAHGDPDKVLYGFTAEQGGSVMPELMGRDVNGQPNTFDYIGVVPVLVKAVQELQAEVERLKKQH